MDAPISAQTPSHPPIAVGAGSLNKAATSLWRALSRGPARTGIVGDPLHEAWTADGEPLERMTHAQQSRASAARYLIVPHSRAR